jgi:hypothetical protein
VATWNSLIGRPTCAPSRGLFSDEVIQADLAALKAAQMDGGVNRLDAGQPAVEAGARLGASKPGDAHEHGG